MTTVAKIVTTTIQHQEVIFQPAANFVVQEATTVPTTAAAWRAPQEALSPTPLERAEFKEKYEAKQSISDTPPYSSSRVQPRDAPTPIPTPMNARRLLTPLNLSNITNQNAKANKSPNRNCDPSSRFSANSMAQGPTPNETPHVSEIQQNKTLINAVDMIISPERIEALYSICATNDPSIKGNKPLSLRELVTCNVNNKAWELGVDIVRIPFLMAQEQAIQEIVKRVLTMSTINMVPITEAFATKLVNEFVAAYKRVAGIAQPSSTSSCCSSCVIM